MTAVGDQLAALDALAEVEPPKPACERTAAENQEAKADALGLAMHRRGLWMRDIAHLPDTSRDRQAPTLAKLARTAYREAADDARYRRKWGEPPAQPPHGKGSDTWRLVPGVLRDLAARGVPRDLAGERDYWTQGAPCPTTPSPSSPARGVGTTSTSTTSAPAVGGQSVSTTPGPQPAPADGDLQALRYRRSLGTCRACTVEVRWVITRPDADDRRTVVALYQDPDPAGGWVVDEATLTGRPLRHGERTDQPRWVAHAPVCTGRPRARGEANARRSRTS